VALTRTMQKSAIGGSSRCHVTSEVTTLRRYTNLFIIIIITINFGTPSYLLNGRNYGIEIYCAYRRLWALTKTMQQ